MRARQVFCPTDLPVRPRPYINLPLTLQQRVALASQSLLLSRRQSVKYTYCTAAIDSAWTHFLFTCDPLVYISRLVVNEP